MNLVHRIPVIHWDFCTPSPSGPNLRNLQWTHLHGQSSGLDRTSIWITRLDRTRRRSVRGRFFNSGLKADASGRADSTARPPATKGRAIADVIDTGINRRHRRIMVRGFSMPSPLFRVEILFPFG